MSKGSKPESKGSKPDDRPLPDFDEWMNLANTDPEAFEEERRRHIDSFINNAPEDKRQRLIGLQWQVDQVRRMSDNPLASCIAISNMMRESLDNLNLHQNKLLDAWFDPKSEPLPVDTRSADVIPLSTRTRH